MSCRFICFFFFKQKTAYEMRISDWSSDVCSSDLVVIAGAGPFGRDLSGDARYFRCINMAAIAKLSRCHRQHPAKLTAAQYADGGAGRKCGHWGSAATSAVCFSRHASSRSARVVSLLARMAAANRHARSEEHTSELQ